ncbi:MAG: hypothetical protein E7244_20845 [Enterocloster citroniae]|nr:hypothetical protein [Enterocloster citroniae]
MASVSGTGSLGNTSLRGYGGLVSGIDRDQVIEQLTAATNAKITNKKSEMTKLSWKQEAFQSISNKILALQDNFMSYSSSSNLKDASIFAKNRISILGDSKVTKFVSATGSSSLVNSLAILGVRQTATASTRISDKKNGTDSITADRITEENLNNPAACQTSNLKGSQLTFGYYNEVTKKYDATATFSFPSAYKDEDGKSQKIDYTDIYGVDGNADAGKITELTDKLNTALKQSGLKLGENQLSDVFEFGFDADSGSFRINTKAGHENTNIVLRDTSSALGALGYKKADGADTSKGISLKASNNVFNANSSDFASKSVKRQSVVQYLTGRKVSFSYGGQTKEIELVKKGETFSDLSDLAAKMTERLEKAFGVGNVTAEAENGTLKFKVGDSSQNLTINESDPEVRSMLGILNGASNKLSLNASLWDNKEKLGLDAGDFDSDGNGYIEINKTKIKFTKNTTINELMDKINNNKEIGVKASYLSTTNQFVLVADETGKRGEIDLGANGAGEKLFGCTYTEDGNGKRTYTNGGSSEDGKNAQILVSYGNGINTMVESLSNSFDLAGLRVTVSGEFGDVKGSEGNWSYDKSQAVTFSASADIDGVTEKVKKFIEDYNALVEEINTQITTKPDSSYGPLTDEQKDEMSETSIENWEKKAKQGILFNDTTMRELSMDMQGVLTELVGSVANYADLEDIGITISTDYKDGGKLVFNESAFRTAMTDEPDKVSNIITGGGDVKKGLTKIIEDTLTPYANRYPERNGGSYGRLIAEAGSEKLPLSVQNNQIYRELKEMEEAIEKFRLQLKSEQDRYINQFTRMETMINQMNAQASYLSQLQG